ncbi:sugar phosphate isomerase/epimerase family protein [Leucobacter chromiiresistens]|uniref:AP endonuclease n=1 Tax=Leucobacter chromiiresistens TaxID=1079994 RepID=A0A147EMA8_9MICO|nr:TIM barrel protein [Leucobacter chromiiresistens]KTR85539.1 AP endonuclease [Leucobacter chromiiresistens]
MTIELARVAGSNFSYQHHPLERCFDDLAALGRTAVELWGVAPHLHVPWASDDDARRVRRAAAERGLDIVCFTPEQVMYPVNIASPDRRLRAESIAMFRRAAELAAELGSPKLFLTPGRGFEREPREAAWRRSVDAIGEIAGRAAELGVACLLEPLQRVESNLVNTARDAARALADIGASNLGVALDTVAMSAAGETVDETFAVLGDRVRHVHLIDGSPTGHLAWGDGSLDLRGILAALERHGYSGWMTIELFGDGSYALDPRPALARSLAAIEAALPSPAR